MLAVHWIHVAQHRVQLWAFLDTVMNLQVVLKVGNFLFCWATISFSNILLH